MDAYFYYIIGKYEFLVSNNIERLEIENRNTSAIFLYTKYGIYFIDIKDYY